MDSNNFTYTFKRSGTHMIEFWGNLINGEVIYACDYAYVKKKSIIGLKAKIKIWTIVIKNCIS